MGEIEYTGNEKIVLNIENIKSKLNYYTMMENNQYTFNNLYHPAAMELSDGTSLLFTTRGSNIRLQGDLNYDEKVDIYDILYLNIFFP